MCPILSQTVQQTQWPCRNTWSNDCHRVQQQAPKKVKVHSAAASKILSFDFGKMFFCCWSRSEELQTLTKNGQSPKNRFAGSLWKIIRSCDLTWKIVIALVRTKNCMTSREKVCCGWVHQKLLKLYKLLNAVHCLTRWKQPAGSQPNTCQVSLQEVVSIQSTTIVFTWALLEFIHDQKIFIRVQLQSCKHLLD